MGTTLKVAAVQMECVAGRNRDNLARAAALVGEAVAQGAQLVLLPELVPGGYILTEAIWDSAEPQGGPSVAWLKEVASRFGIHLGMSALEAEGEHFYNAFYLATPEGGIAGRVRKNPPASVEAYFYRAGADPHVIETSLGRIGVSICYESLLWDNVRETFMASVDLVLQPTSAATPTPTFPMGRKDAQAFEAMLADGPAVRARGQGVPVVMANKCGAFVGPLPGGFPAQNTRFPGLSSIVDGDGAVKARLGGEEGVIVAEVTLDPARKARHCPKGRGRWSMRVPWYAFLWPVSQSLGERAYRRNARRAVKARAIASA